MPAIRTSAGDNSHVNSKDFGRIAHSAAVQQGDENQREWYNGIRGGSGADANGQTQKVSAQQRYAKSDKNSDVTVSSKPSKGATDRASSQRAGGKGK
jgi:hypothetical protein